MAAIIRIRRRSGSATGRGRENRDEPRTVDVASRLLRDDPPGAMRAADGAHGDRAGAVGVAAGPRDQAKIPIRRRDEHHSAIRVERIADGGGGFVAEQFRKGRRVDEAPDDRIVRADGRQRVGGFGRRQLRRRLLRFDEIARSAERFEQRRRNARTDARPASARRRGSRGARAQGGSARSGSPRRSSSNTLALCAMSWYASDRRSADPCSAPRRRRNSPHAPGMARASMRLATVAEPRFRFGCSSRREQRFARDEIGLNRFRRRGLRQRFRWRACSASSVAPRRAASFASRTRIDHSYHEARLRAVAAVGLAGSAAGSRRPTRIRHASARSARACRRPHR